MSDEYTVELLHCHICSRNLKRHPLYSPSVAMTCTSHGDFFVQRLRDQAPTIHFRGFETTQPIQEEIAEVVEEIPEKPIVYVPLVRFHTPKTSFPPPVYRKKRRGNPGIKVRCDQTGEVFESIRQAGITMNISYTRITMYLKNQIEHVNGYTFTKIEDHLDQPWDKKPRLRFGGGVPAIGIRCNQTGDIYSSIREAARSMGIARMSLARHLHDPINHPRMKGYSFTKLS